MALEGAAAAERAVVREQVVRELQAGCWRPRPSIARRRRRPATASGGVSSPARGACPGAAPRTAPNPGLPRGWSSALRSEWGQRLVTEVQGKCSVRRMYPRRPSRRRRLG